MVPSPTQRRGARHEQLAEQVLVARGYRVIERNWRGGGGEVDRVAWSEGLLCFVEVRSRVGGAGGTPEETVGRTKRMRLIRAAAAYLTRFPPGDLPMVRFDVVAVVIDPDSGRPEVRVIENAFDAEGWA